MKSGREAACLSRPKGSCLSKRPTGSKPVFPWQPGWLFFESLRYLKSRNAIGRAFRDSVDDSLPRARISEQVRFGSRPDCESARSGPAVSWKLLLLPFARANDRKSPSDIAFQYQDPGDSTSWDCGSTKKRQAVRYR